MAVGESVQIAHIDTTHGLRGELSAALCTDFPERFDRLELVELGRSADPERWKSYQLQGWKLHRGKILLKLEGIEDCDAARALVGCSVWVRREDAVGLPADTYFHQDLLGLTVRDRGGRVIGRVHDILVTGGTDVLVVQAEEGEILIPAARSICVEVDLKAGEVVVDPPEGLLEINAS